MIPMSYGDALRLFNTISAEHNKDAFLDYLNKAIKAEGFRVVGTKLRCMQGNEAEQNRHWTMCMLNFKFSK